MSKSVVAEIKEYNPIVPGYYTQAFKKTNAEKEEIRSAKRAHQRAIKNDYPEYNASQRKRIINPRS